MSGLADQRRFANRSTAIFLFGVIGMAAVGYFVGINDGVPREDPGPVATTLLDDRFERSEGVADSMASVPAARYAEMRRTETGPTSRWKPTLAQIPQPAFDLYAEFKPSEEDKRQSTLTRASRRAFNGAPPVIPHEVERTADAACYACHGQGMRIDGRVANRMSHGFLANCTQCHAPPPPKPFSDHVVPTESNFVGLPAPMKGERAFPGAPPTIPHSTWMRETCLACHGREAGWAGLESTHPWRINCQQCHAPSAKLDQAVTADPVGFLPAIDVVQP